MHRTLLGLMAAALLGCGGPAATPPKSAAAPASTTAASAPRRTPTDAIQKRWGFDQRPDAVVYADLEGLLRTDLLQGVIGSAIGLAGSSVNEAQAKCVRDLAASARELLAATNDERGFVAVVRYEPSAMKSTPAACLKILSDAKPTRIDGAAEAYRIQDGVVAVDKGFLVFGDKPTAIAAALAGRGDPAALRDIALSGDQYVGVLVERPAEHVSARGGLYASNERFRIDADVDLPDDRFAEELEAHVAPLRGGALGQLAPGAPRDVLAALQHLAEAFSMSRRGKRVMFAFELREAPVDQARDIGIASALAIAGVRRYLVRAKQAEARNIVRQIAKSIVASWEAEDAPSSGRRAKKKLVSFPPVPSAIPHAMKYRSSEADWKAWQPIRFELTMPQSYQYEVKAAPDGKSAEVIARGDLDGDGKTSLFRIAVKVDKDRLVVSPDIEERDPDE